MRYNLKHLVIVSITLYILTGCEKIDYTSQADTNQLTAKGGNCPMTLYHFYDADNNSHQYDYLTHKNGLVDEWLVSYDLTFKMEYGNNKKLIKSLCYDGSLLLNTIHFVYQNNKIVKELWYVGASSVLDDEIIITYNAKGQITKTESLTYYYLCTFTYDMQGNATSWFYKQGDMPVAKGEYTFPDKNYKNPWNTNSELVYYFAYANGAFFQNKKWYASEKITFYDPSGTPSVYYDLDPTKTIWETGNQNNLKNVKYYTDASATLSVSTNFEYGNCGGAGNSNRPGLQATKSVRSISGSPKHFLHEEAYKTFLKERKNNKP